MSNDHWLLELVQVNRENEARERGLLDERWDRLSSGELSPEEEAELRGLAETSAVAREAYEAFRPLGPDFQAGVVQAIRNQRLAAEAGPAAQPVPKLLPFAARAGRAARWSGAAAVAAAAVLVLLLRPPPPLPGYSLEVRGGVSAMRGEPQQIPALAPGDPFEALLRPLTAALRAQRLEARSFVSRGQDLRHLEFESQPDPGGAVKIEGTVPFDLQPGTWTLWAVVGRRGELPEVTDLRHLPAGRQARQRDWVAVSKTIRIQPRDLPP